MEQHLFRCVYVDNYQFALAKSQDTAAIDEFEGQLRIDVSATSVVPGMNVQFTLNDLRLMHDDLEAALTRFGSVRDFVNVSVDEHNLRFVFRFEFYSVEVANRARASLRDQEMTRQCDNVSLIDPSPLPFHTNNVQGLWAWTITNADNWTGPRPPNSPHRRFPRVDDKGRFMDFQHAEVKSAPAFPPEKAADKNHNRVIYEKIKEGIDVRTTIMLRNIPNKLDWVR